MNKKFTIVNLLNKVQKLGKKWQNYFILKYKNESIKKVIRYTQNPEQKPELEPIRKLFYKNLFQAWQSKSRITKIIIVIFSLMSLNSLIYIVILKLDLLKSSKALMPIAKSAIQFTSDLKIGSYSEYFYCSKILALEYSKSSIYRYIDAHHLEPKLVEKVFNYINRVEGNINFIGPYLLPELKRLCYKTQTKGRLLNIDMWKL